MKISSALLGGAALVALPMLYSPAVSATTPHVDSYRTVQNMPSPTNAGRTGTGGGAGASADHDAGAEMNNSGAAMPSGNSAMSSDTSASADTEKSKHSSGKHKSGYKRGAAKDGVGAGADADLNVDGNPNTPSLRTGAGGVTGAGKSTTR
ncbi:MAG: hypothetical protein AB7H77_02700 [Bdellovibrionales bacterium]